MTDFAIGQRYLSDTENELGWASSCLLMNAAHILFPQSEETRVCQDIGAFVACDFQSQGIPYMTKMAHRMWSAILKKPMASINTGLKVATVRLWKLRLAANINLAKPLNACSPVVSTKMIGTNCAKSYCVPKPYLASHPLRGFDGCTCRYH